MPDVAKRIESSSMTYTYDKVTLRHGDNPRRNYEENVGVGVKACLFVKDMDCLMSAGSPPNQRVFATAFSWIDRNSSSFVRGHLLNADLGGDGGFYNLFPFTNSANVFHSGRFEEHVKRYMHANHAAYKAYLDQMKKSETDKDTPKPMVIDYDNYFAHVSVNIDIPANNVNLCDNGPFVNCVARDQRGNIIAMIRFNAFKPSAEL